jgi:hypothetical protein
MHMLRTSSRLARLILAWFVLTVGVAIASPLVHPQAFELVCTTGNTMKLVVIGEEDANAAPAGHHTLDCPLCLHFSAPAPQAQAVVEPRQPLAHSLLPAVKATIAALVGSPLPPRGPPAFAS